MDKAIRTLIVVLLLFSGCATRRPEGEVYYVSIWRCANSASFSGYFDAHGALVILAAYQKYVLRPAPSATGERYVDGEVELVKQRRKVTLLGAAGGPYRDCVRNGRW